MSKNWWERTGKTYEERYTKWERFWFALTHLRINLYCWYLRKTGHKGISFKKEGLVLWKNLPVNKTSTLIENRTKLMKEIKSGIN